MYTPLLDNDEEMKGNEENVLRRRDNYMHDEIDDVREFKKECRENEMTFKKLLLTIGELMTKKWYCLVFFVLYNIAIVIIYFIDWKHLQIENISYKVCYLFCYSFLQK